MPAPDAVDAEAADQRAEDAGDGVGGGGHAHLAELRGVDRLGAIRCFHYVALLRQRERRRAPVRSAARPSAPPY